MSTHSVESQICCCYNANCCPASVERFSRQSKSRGQRLTRNFSDLLDLRSPTENTPLIGQFVSSHNERRNSDSGHNAGESTSRKCSLLRHFKTSVLTLLIIFTLITFLTTHEKRDTYHSITVKSGEPEFLNLSKKLDLVAPVWNIKVSGAFIPHELSNLTQQNVLFSIVKLSKNGSQLLTGPWAEPIAPAEMAKHIPVREIQHNFNIKESYETVSDDEEDIMYQLNISTTQQEPISLSISATAHSEVSLQGLIMSAVVLTFLYTLLIFEIVPRTLAAMLGATLALVCLTLVGERPSLELVVSWLDMETLSLLFGMMIMVAILCETGFFDWISVCAFRWASGRTWPLIMILCLLTAVLSAFLDNVTTVLLMTPVTIRLCEIKNIDPKHVLIAQVIFSNIGGAATPIGDPPNVIIISSTKIKNMGVDFTKFTYHITPGIVVCLMATVALFKWLYRDLTKLSFQEPQEVIDYLAKLGNRAKAEERGTAPVTHDARYHRSSISAIAVSPVAKAIEQLQDDSLHIKSPIEVKREIEVWKKACSSIAGYSRDEHSVRVVLERKVQNLEDYLTKQMHNLKSSNENYKRTLAELEMKYRIKNKPLLIKSVCVMAVVVALFFCQSVPNFDLNLGWIAIFGALAALVVADFEELESVIARVEWSTLIFFAALFVVMEALSQLKFLLFIGELTQSLIDSVDDDHKLFVAICLILWVSAFASSLIDNIPFATVMVKIIEDLAEKKDLNLPMTPLVYALALGSCLGGNGTLVGASANVVCAGVAEQHGYRFTFMDFFKVGFPVMLLTVAISTAYLLVCHCVFEWHEAI